MKTFCIVVVVVIAGCACSDTIPEYKNILRKLFGNYMHNGFQLDTTYFTIRPAGAPSDSTLFRFVLANGALMNVDEKLKPKFDETHCKTEGDEKAGYDLAKCTFDFEGMVAKYFGIFLYGADVQQVFNVTVTVERMEHGHHKNPALLAVFIYNSSWCPSECTDCKVTEFDVKEEASPPFEEWASGQGRQWDLFKKNKTLAKLVWEDFKVAIYTKVRPIIKETLRKVCLEKASKRWKRLRRPAKRRP